jgi:hypothetical protein
VARLRGLVDKLVGSSSAGEQGGLEGLGEAQQQQGQQGQQGQGQQQQRAEAAQQAGGQGSGAPAPGLPHSALHALSAREWRELEGWLRRLALALEGGLRGEEGRAAAEVEVEACMQRREHATFAQLSRPPS